MKYHFISIGGSIMHNLAIAMLLNGNEVTGSDDEIFEPAKSHLEKYGLLPSHIGWNPDNITTDIDIVVLGMHAKADNPELLRAKELNLRIVSFPELIYLNSKNKTRIVISGSHGKTTVTSMVLHVLKSLNIDADYLVGAKVPGFDVMVKITDDAKYLVVEGDEYLTSTLDPRPKFHLYHPHVALTTGIAWDHFNVFPTFQNYVRQFEDFAALIEPDGTFIFFEEDEELQKIAKNIRNDITTISYGTPDYKITNDGFVIQNGNAEYKMQIVGKHNMQNVLGAKLICNKLGINDIDYYNAISSFVGAANRMQKVYEKGSVVVYKDFAHAPSKVAATLNAVKEFYPKRKIIAAFELHTYSSLNINFIQQYKGTLHNADVKIVYFDPEALALKKLPGLDKKQVMAAFDDGVEVFDNIEELKEFINTKITHNCVILMMSSGNFGGFSWHDLKL